MGCTGGGGLGSYLGAEGPAPVRLQGVAPIVLRQQAVELPAQASNAGAQGGGGETGGEGELQCLWY